MQQHEKISGYRTLNETEIAAMNELKALEAQILEIVDRRDVLSPTQASRESFANGRSRLKEAFMWLNRGIARPNGE